MKAVLLAIAALLFSTTAVAADALSSRNEGIDEARARGWPVVSMKDDWKRIFPDVAP